MVNNEFPGKPNQGQKEPHTGGQSQEPALLCWDVVNAVEL